jgi:hypothetical protein
MVAMSNMGGSMRNQDLANALANGSQPLLVNGIMQLQPSPAANQSDKEKADLFYKTELCKHWEKEGACPYGDKCQFAHGRNQLRFVVRSKKYKTKRCKTFWSTGHCPYGSRCCFLHDPEEDARLLSDMTTFIFDQASGETIETGNSPNQRGNGKAKKQDRRQRKGSVGAVGESVPQSSMSTFNQVMGIDPGEKPPAGSGFGGKKQPRGGGQPPRGGVKGGAPRNGNQASIGRGNRKNQTEGSALRKSQSFQNSSQEVGFKSPVESSETDGRGKSFSTSFIPGFGDGNLGLVNNNWLFQSSQPVFQSSQPVFQYSQPAPESDILFNAPNPPQSQQQASWTTDLSNLGVGLDGLTLHGGGGPPSGGGGSAEVVKRVGSSSSGDVDVTGTSKMPPPMVTDHHLPPASSLHQNGLFNTPYPAKTEHVALATAGGGDSDKVPGKESGAEAFLQNASTFLLQTAA